MRAYYCDHFVLPLPAGHRFPMEKYSLLRQRLVDEGVLDTDQLSVPNPVDDELIKLVHTPTYVNAVINGSLSDSEQRRIGFPWSPALVERSRRSAGGTLAACQAALEEGVAVNLAGGTHHAFADRGEGFCVFNDAAISARALQQRSAVRNVLVVDCDVHQGNGTAAVFQSDPTVFTFSIHGRNNYPFRKEKSDLDIELDDGIGDDHYLTALTDGLDRVCSKGLFDLAIYVSGADPFVGDKLGRLGLSKSGLAQRDQVVFRTLRAYDVPVAVVMAGGYAANVEDTVDIHLATVALAAQAAKGRGHSLLPN